MKKGFCLVLLVTGLLMNGCAESKPEDAARKIVDEKVAVHHEGFDLDTSRVVYTVLEQDEETARVEVSGDIAVKAVIPLAKKGGTWVLDAPHAGKAAKGAHPPAKKTGGH